VFVETVPSSRPYWHTVQTASLSLQSSSGTAISPAQVALVQESFLQVLPVADAAGVMLYERIFALAPGTRALFGADIGPQASRLIAAIAAAVDGLDDFEEVAPFLVRLGARHMRYGVCPQHFDVAGAALLWTLEQKLGASFTPQVRDAWAAAWGVIAAALLRGMFGIA
jgi:nitric oxide dioxygenase